MSEGTNPGIPSPDAADATQFQPSGSVPEPQPEEIEERTRFIAPDDMARAAAPEAAPPPQVTEIPQPTATTSAPRVTQNPFAVPAPATARKIEIGGNATPQPEPEQHLDDDVAGEPRELGEHPRVDAQARRPDGERGQAALATGVPQGQPAYDEPQQR